MVWVPKVEPLLITSPWPTPKIPLNSTWVSFQEERDQETWERLSPSSPSFLGLALDMGDRALCIDWQILQAFCDRLWLEARNGAGWNVSEWVLWAALWGPNPVSQSSWMNICPDSLSRRMPIDRKAALGLSVATGPACSPALCVSCLGSATWRQHLTCTAFLILTAILWGLSASLFRWGGCPRSCSQWGLWKSKQLFCSWWPHWPHRFSRAGHEMGRNVPVVALLAKLGTTWCFQSHYNFKDWLEGSHRH